MSRLRDLTEADVAFRLDCEPEHEPFEGNAMSSGDDKADRETEEWIRSELASGNDWAWCCARVTATWESFESVQYLGACSYRSEADFREPGGYFDDMRAEALTDLNRQVFDAFQRISQLVQS